MHYSTNIYHGLKSYPNILLCKYSIRYRPLIKILEEIQERFHGPQYWDKRSIIMTSGAQEGLSKAVDMCMRCNDPVIMPDPVYTGAVDLVKLSIIRYLINITHRCSISKSS